MCDNQVAYMFEVKEPGWNWSAHKINPGWKTCMIQPGERSNAVVHLVDEYASDYM